jgi:hypothetical protein
MKIKIVGTEYDFPDSGHENAGPGWLTFDEFLGFCGCAHRRNALVQMFTAGTMPPHARKSVKMDRYKKEHFIDVQLFFDELRKRNFDARKRRSFIVMAMAERFPELSSPVMPAESSFATTPGPIDVGEGTEFDFSKTTAEALSTTQTQEALVRMKTALAVMRAHQVLRKERGELVERKAVDKALFAFASEIRARVLGVSGIVVDEVWGAPSRAHAKRALDAALADALTELARAETMKYTPTSPSAELDDDDE